MTTEPTGAIDMHNYEQNAHLPECPDQHSSHDGTCICSALRACEARVFVDRTDHWNSALDAAWDAVVAQRAVTPNLIRRDDVLAAIDALRSATPGGDE